MEKKDIKLTIEDINFSIRVVGVIIKNNKVLFQKRKNDKYWALPGGKVEISEKTQDVIIRELYEEIGLTDIEIKRPLWFTEYFFDVNNTKHHQYIIGYLLDIKDNEKIINIEEFDGIEPTKNIIYKWIKLSELKNTDIKPDYLSEKLTNIKEEFEFISVEE